MSKIQIMWNRCHVSSKSDIVTLYNEVHLAYQNKDKKPSKLLCEWMALSSFLKKNASKKCKTIRLVYPYEITKSEKPDFIIENYYGSKIYLEVVRITPMNWEKVKTQSYKNDLHMIETSAKLYDDNAEMSTNELSDLFIKTGDELSDNPIYGSYKEMKWAELCYRAIQKKSNKDYPIDILLLDDHQISSSYKENIETGISFLQKEIIHKDLRVTNIKTIISENPSGILLLYKNKKWCFKARYVYGED